MNRKRPVAGLIGAILIGSAWLSSPLLAAEPMEKPGVARLPEPTDHWLWVPDRILRHSLLFDGDSGRVLGMLDSASLLTPRTPLLSRKRSEFYVSDTAYSRGSRGERVDFVSIFDARDLSYKDEILVPTRQGESNASIHYAELLGDRFMAVFNQFPNTSASILDLDRRSFVEEIVITGCAGIYPVSEHRFATLCGNGTALLVVLDDAGRKLRVTPSKTFFDPIGDPAFMAAGRDGARWTFVSFHGQVWTVDFSGEAPTVGPSWSLVDEAERDAGWRPGGLQHVALHSAKKRLYVAMHQGEPGSHKNGGSEIWIHDVESGSRLDRFTLPNLTAGFLGPLVGVEPGSFSDRLMQWLVPGAGVHSIAVSQDERPLLFARNAELGAVAVLDAMTGETLRILGEAGLAGPSLRVP